MTAEEMSTEMNDQLRRGVNELIQGHYYHMSEWMLSGHIQTELDNLSCSLFKNLLKIIREGSSWIILRKKRLTLFLSIPCESFFRITECGNSFGLLLHNFVCNVEILG